MMQVYFGAPEEAAVRAYVYSADQAERERLFTRTIYRGFEGMAKGVVATFKNLDCNLRHDLALELPAFLWERLDKFDPARGTKAYSYFTQACVNYILTRLKQAPAVEELTEQNCYLPDEGSEAMELREERLENIESFESKLLSAHEQIIFREYFHNNRTMKAIADKIGVSHYVVYEIVRDCRVKMRRAFGLSDKLVKMNKINK
jgi:RNA polymerase sigma factor (sigma-70 family)